MAIVTCSGGCCIAAKRLAAAAEPVAPRHFLQTRRVAPQVAAIFAPIAIAEQHIILSGTRRRRAADHTGCAVLAGSLRLDFVVVVAIVVIVVLLVVGIDEAGNLFAVAAPLLGHAPTYPILRVSRMPNASR
jgi:hypothetical protein